MQENAIALIISFQMGDSYNSGSQLGAPVAKEPPLLTHRTWNFPCNLLDLVALRRLPLIAEEAVKTAGAALPQGHFYVRCAIFPSKRSIKNAPRKRHFTGREGQDETAPQAPVAYPVGDLPGYPAAAVHLLAHLAQSKWGWGGWIMAVAIVSGLAASACSAVSFLHYCKRTAEKETKGEKPIAYNDHE